MTVSFTIKEMLEAGVHFGHNKRRWNPKMVKYIYGTHNNIHIVDLQKTAPLLNNALEKITEVVSRGGRILFVGTKRQAQEIIKEYAEKSGQYYVNHRWLGGMLTNLQTISKSIKYLEKLEGLLQDESLNYSKKERLSFSRERDKLSIVLGGIRDMGALPDLIFVVDARKESIAVQEANKLGIPIISIVDTNSNPDNINYIIPGNDDALKAIDFYCRVVSEAIFEGLEAEVSYHQKNREDKAKRVEKSKENTEVKVEDTTAAEVKE